MEQSTKLKTGTKLNCFILGNFPGEEGGCRVIQEKEIVKFTDSNELLPGGKL